MDYTPGAMTNANKSNFRHIYSNPMSQGTRCHQLALYTLFESPLVMLADSPTEYQREDASTKFIASIPTTFDETHVLEGDISKYAVIARRKRDSWYLGGITNWNARNVVLDLSFLENGNYQIELFQDGINADRQATDYKRTVFEVKRGDKLAIHLAPGGGFAAKIVSVSK